MRPTLEQLGSICIVFGLDGYTLVTLYPACLIGMGGIVEKGRAESEHNQNPPFFRLYQFGDTRIHYSASLDSQGHFASNSQWLHNP